MDHWLNNHKNINNNDLLNSNGTYIFDIFTKDDRLVYIGVMFIIMSVFLYYIEISKSSKV